MTTNGDASSSAGKLAGRTHRSGALPLLALVLLGGCRTVTQGPQLTRIPPDDAVLATSALPDSPILRDLPVTGGIVYHWVGEPYAGVGIERYGVVVSRALVEKARDREAPEWLTRYGPRNQVLPPPEEIAPLESFTIDGRPGWSWYLGPGPGRPNARRIVVVVPWDETSTWALAIDCAGDGMTREEMATIVGSFVVADRQRQDLIGALILGALATVVGWMLWRARTDRPKAG